MHSQDDVFTKKGVDIDQIIAVEKKVIAKSGKKFRRKSPWLFSLVSTFLFLLASLPFWSYEEYSKGYKRGVLLAAHDSGIAELPVEKTTHQVRNFLMIITIGAFIGFVTGIILIFFGKTLISLLWGTMIGAVVTLLLTVGTYLQMLYYKRKGVTDGMRQFNLQYNKILASYEKEQYNEVNNKFMHAKKEI